jgi:hypothetical protein
MFMHKVTIPAHVDTSQIITWLHDHVGELKSKHMYSCQGTHWSWNHTALFADWRCSTDLIWKQVVTFDDQVSPDLITQFVLTFT